MDGVDRILTAQESISWNRDFLRQLCEETPWASPFSVCGTTARHGNLKIEENFSNFEEMSQLAQSDYKKDGFRNVGNPYVYDLRPDSYSSTGFSLSYIDGYGAKKSRERCALSIVSPGYTEGISSLRGLAFSCNHFGPGEVNTAWLDSGVIDRILRLVISSFTHCVSLRFSTRKLIDYCIDGTMDPPYDAYMRGGPIIGPITYFGNPAVFDILKDEPDMQPYGDGLLFRLTDDIVHAEHLEIVNRLHAIRRKLQDAGIKNLKHGINRADWGCDSSSVLQGEPEIWYRRTEP